MVGFQNRSNSYCILEREVIISEEVGLEGYEIGDC